LSPNLPNSSNAEDLRDILVLFDRYLGPLIVAACGFYTSPPCALRFGTPQAFYLIET
jgi:hypothetical protein